MADFIKYVRLSSINNHKIGFGGNAGFCSNCQLHQFRSTGVKIFHSVFCIRLQRVFFNILKFTDPNL